MKVPAFSTLPYLFVQQRRSRSRGAIRAVDDAGTERNDESRFRRAAPRERANDPTAVINGTIGIHASRSVRGQREAQQSGPCDASARQPKAPPTECPPHQLRGVKVRLPDPSPGRHGEHDHEQRHAYASSQVRAAKTSSRARSRGVRIPVPVCEVTPDWVTADHPIGPHTADDASRPGARSPSDRANFEESGGGGIVTETYELAFRGEPGPVTRASSRSLSCDRKGIDGVSRGVRGSGWAPRRHRTCQLARSRARRRVTHRGRQPMSRVLRTAALGPSALLRSRSLIQARSVRSRRDGRRPRTSVLPHRRLDGPAAQPRSM